MIKRLLLTGGDGFVARELAAALAYYFEITVLGHTECDVTDFEKVTRALDASEPDLVIHLAGWVDKVRCEMFPETARLVNVGGTLNVARACSRSGAKMVFLSTDFVFDGSKNSPYVESDVPAPVNVYGSTKFEAEKAAAEQCAAALIIRTSRLFGTLGRNFISMLPKLLSAEKQLPVVDDEVSSVTFIRDFAAALAEMIRNNREGVYHLVNTGECTVFEFAETLKARLGSHTRLEPSRWRNIMPRVSAPQYCTLATERADAAGEIRMRHWTETIDVFLSQVSHG